MENQPMDIEENNHNGTEKLDEALYSRQLYVLGHEAMKRMSSSDVLLVGLRGLGLEIAKNLILAGVRSVTLYDDNPATLFDLSAQYYLTEKDIGKPRAQACLTKLAELNSYVAVSVHTGELTEAVIKKFKVVVTTDQNYAVNLKLNQICRANNIYFVGTSTRGVFSYIFNDFGDNFVVNDPNGEQPFSAIVASVTQENPGIVTVVDDQRLPFEDGEWVQFNEIKGMEELNNTPPRQIKILSPYTFSIEDTSKYGAYKGGGYVTQVKQPVALKFKTLEESWNNPEFLTSDFAKFDREVLIHLGFRALDEFERKHESLPAPHNEDHANEVVKIVQELNDKFQNKIEKLEDKEIKLIKQLSYGARGELAFMTAVIGGIAAQEVLKSVSGKFTPTKQWLYFDSTEILPSTELPPEEYQPVGSRYDGQIVVIGRSLQEQIRQLNFFLVGAGAIGCETLKIWAMMGLGTAQNGSIHVTDMDIIEKSNLNRQFLFRPKDIEQPKSTTASNAVKEMNRELNIHSYTSRVGPETEEQFNESFYKSLHGVCNALDNVEARLYMDSQCILYKKPLFESGTLGTKGNTQVVVPFITESYASSRDPPEKSIPTCTLHHFPNTIDHTIQWARDLFEGLYKNQSNNVNSYLTNPSFIPSLMKQSIGIKLETLSTIKSSLVTDRAVSFDQCVRWSRMRFEEYFNNNIKQLLYNFPPDMITSNGTPFWSGPKRAPKPIEFDMNDPLHLDFIISSSNLRAEIFGLKGEKDPEIFKSILSDIIVPEFTPKKVKINIDDDKSKDKDNNQQSSSSSNDNDDDDDDTVKKLITEIPQPNSLTGFQMKAIDFEKDDDTNFHMDFITSVANLRAMNYSIPLADKHKCKGIAGKIIPAMVTTTAVVCGLVAIELIKVIQNKKIDDLKNGFINLALPFFGFSEPLQPQKTKIRDDWSWTLWDTFDIDGSDNMTLKQFLDYFKDKYKLEVTMISCGVSMIYSFFMPKDKLSDRLNKQLSEVISTVSKQELPKKKNYLTMEICCNRLEDDEEVDVPTVRFIFRK